MMSYVLLILVSFYSMASEFTGNFMAYEMDPHGDDSRPVYELEVNYHITLKGEGALRPELSGIQSIKAGASGVEFYQAFFQLPKTNFHVALKKSDIKLLSIMESAVGPGKKEILFEAEIIVVDAQRINSLFKASVPLNKNEIRLAEELSSAPLKLWVSVAQLKGPRARSKYVGEQIVDEAQLSLGKITLDQIDFQKIKKNRPLVYGFHWKLQGHELNTNNSEVPQITLIP
jgi:hypothetical protein